MWSVKSDIMRVWSEYLESVEYGQGGLEIWYPLWACLIKGIEYLMREFLSQKIEKIKLQKFMMNVGML